MKRHARVLSSWWHLPCYWIVSGLIIQSALQALADHRALVRSCPERDSNESRSTDKTFSFGFLPDRRGTFVGRLWDRPPDGRLVRRRIWLRISRVPKEWSDPGKFHSKFRGGRLFLFDYNHDDYNDYKTFTSRGWLLESHGHAGGVTVGLTWRGLLEDRDSWLACRLTDSSVSLAVWQVHDCRWSLSHSISPLRTALFFGETRTPPLRPQMTSSLHTRDRDPPNLFAARHCTHSSVETLQRQTYFGKIRLRRLVFKPSGTLGEPHEVTAPFLAFVPCSHTSCIRVHYFAQCSNPTGRR